MASASGDTSRCSRRSDRPTRVNQPSVIKWVSPSLMSRVATPRKLTVTRGALALTAAAGSSYCA